MKKNLQKALICRTDQSTVKSYKPQCSSNSPSRLTDGGYGSGEQETCPKPHGQSSKSSEEKPGTQKDNIDQGRLGEARGSTHSSDLGDYPCRFGHHVHHTCVMGWLQLCSMSSSRHDPGARMSQHWKVDSSGPEGKDKGTARWLWECLFWDTCHLYPLVTDHD